MLVSLSFNLHLPSAAVSMVTEQLSRPRCCFHNLLTSSFLYLKLLQLFFAFLDNKTHGRNPLQRETTSEFNRCHCRFPGDCLLAKEANWQASANTKALVGGKGEPPTHESLLSISLSFSSSSSRAHSRTATIDEPWRRFSLPLISVSCVCVCCYVVAGCFTKRRKKKWQRNHRSQSSQRRRAQCPLLYWFSCTAGPRNP